MAFAYELLGTFQVRRCGTPVTVAAAKPRTILAYLLMRAGRPAAVEQLVDEVWGSSPPRSATANVRTYIADLRRLLGGQAVRPIRTVDGGYQIEVEPDHLDVAIFQDLLGMARTALAAGERHGAATLLDRGLRLWRGAALEGVPLGQALSARAHQLNEERYAAIEQLAQLRLDLGQAGDIVSVLDRHVGDQPLREQAHHLLMTALYRSGNTAGALEAFQLARRTMVAQLGIEPGPALVELHQRILNRDPDLLHLQLPPAEPFYSGPPHPERPHPERPHPEPPHPERPHPEPPHPEPPHPERPHHEPPHHEPPHPEPLPAQPSRRAAPEAVRAIRTPQQMPPTPTKLIGRDDEVARLVAAASNTGGPRVIAIHGPAGTGKTALAMTVARALASAYPDGTLFLDLLGATTATRRAASATSSAVWLLRGIDHPAAQVPADHVHAAAVWRSAAADRHMIVVLDDAAVAADVQPLLPAEPCGVTIVTSRRMLPELDALHLGLTPLRPASAQTLLRELVGAARVDADPASTRAISEYCCHLPLALRIAATRLSRRPGYPLHRLADRLADERRRLDELEIDGRGIRSSLRFSYDALASSADPTDTLAARAFRLCGVTGFSLSSLALAAGLGSSANEVDAAVDRLIELRLLESTEPDLLHQHDLLRLFAAEQSVAADEQSWRDCAVRRIYQHYLAVTRESVAKIRPHVPLAQCSPGASKRTGSESVPSGIDELEANLPTLLAITTHAAQDPDRLGDTAVDLLLPLATYLPPRGHWGLLTQIATLAERAAAARHDPLGRARALTSLAMADARGGRIDLAKQRLTEAMAIRVAHGDRRAEASILDNLGLIHYRAGEPGVAFVCYVRALRLHREYDRLVHAATTMHNLSAVYEQLGRPRAAERFLRRSLALRVSTGDRFGEACTLVALGRILATEARPGPASRTLAAGIDLARRVGYWEAEWDGLICQAEIARRDGDLKAAAADLGRAAALARHHRDPYALGLTARCQARLVGAAAPAYGPNTATGPEACNAARPEIEMFLGT